MTKFFGHVPSGLSIVLGIFLAALLAGGVVAADRTTNPHAWRRFFPLARLEPPRNVPAAQWGSLFCSHWDDGCMSCERKSDKEKPACKPIGGALGETACIPKPIVCDRVDQRPGGGHCAVIMFARPLFDGERKIVGYFLSACNPGRCEGGSHRYFADSNDAATIEAYKKTSNGRWLPTDRPSVYCTDSYRDLCRDPSMREHPPCKE